jgi:hypothetical protein
MFLGIVSEWQVVTKAGEKLSKENREADYRL